MDAVFKVSEQSLARWSEPPRRNFSLIVFSLLLIYVHFYYLLSNQEYQSRSHIINQGKNIDFVIQQWTQFTNKQNRMLRYSYKHQLKSNIKRLLFQHSSQFSNVPQCLILHPVSFPNKGPAIEQYLAEEAIGLVSSLRWEVVRGPFWQAEVEDKKIVSYGRLPLNTVYVQPQYGNQIKDGTYVKTSIGSGMLYKDGIMFDEESTETDGDLYSEWQNKSVRQSLANSSLVKCRKITQKYFFTKGKLERIIAHVMKTQPTCLFINSELKPGQIRNLKKLFESQLNNKSPPKGYHSVGQQNQSETQFDSTQDVEQVETSRRKRQQPLKKIQIFDRFSIILQIFAQRTTSKLAKLQIQLSYLAYLKTRLVRDGSTYSSNLNIFSGNLLNNTQISLEIISARQRRAIGTMSGEGQSQLQIERRNIKNQEAKIRKEIEMQLKLRQHKKQKEKNRNISMPIIALVGYTNVGKSAFLNYVMGKNQVESKDLLFQTLKTTSRFIQLPSGTKAALMDTIGFITDLPIEMVDPFKATLEDISHADLVIHLRDLSHPQHELQKQSVLAILKDLKFEPEFYTNKMIQVWNKVDLVEGEGRQKSGEDGLKVSCKTGRNMAKLLTYIDQKVKNIRGLSAKKITYGFDKHEKVMDWLRKIANISYNLKYEHNYQYTPQFPKGSVTVELDLDEVVYNKLTKYINEISNKQPDKDKSRKGLPPKQGW